MKSNNDDKLKNHQKYKIWQKLLRVLHILFSDAYEFLISNYAANAGKSGDEFFTTQRVSKHRSIKIVYYGTFKTEEEAVARVKYFKSGSGREWLIKSPKGAEV